MKNLENNGERMDIDYYNINYNNFDIYQKSHFKRYEFAQSQLLKSDIVGDMACGSGYGSLMLLEKCSKVFGVDIDEETIQEIKKRYEKEKDISFFSKNLLDIDDVNFFDKIISFETIEHFTPEEIKIVISKFHQALKKDGKLIFSTPYNQEQSVVSMKFHKTFYIKEDTIIMILKDLFDIEKFYYQDYVSHNLSENLNHKSFIICVAKKINH